MELSDIEWGDVVADGEDVLEVEGRLGEQDVLVRRFRSPDAPLVEAVRLLDARGERPPDVLGYGPDWICFAAPDPLDELLG